MTIQDLERVKKAVVRKYPIMANLALVGIDIELSNSVETAAVVAERNNKGVLEAKKIFVNPKFFDNLTFSQRVFVLAHEICHISFKHFRRAKNRPDKDAEKKYQEYCQKETNEEKRKLQKAILYRRYNNIWNIATDACINAFLKKDGLIFPEHVIDPKTGKEMKFVDIKDGLYKSSEKIYDFLVKKEEEKQKQREEEKKQQQNQQSDDQSSNPQNQDSDPQNQQSDNQNSNSPSSSEPSDSPSMGDLDDIDVDNYKGFDSHNEWNDDQKKENKENDSEKSDSDELTETEEYSQDSEEEIIDEEEIFKKERENREKKDSTSLKKSFENLRKSIGIDSINNVESVVSWKRYLVGVLEATEEVWGTRRASRFNPNSRIEERDYEKIPSVEVILDVSGSISENLLKGFLLQLCPLFEELYGETTMKVGCFSDYFHGFQEIRTKNDIKSFKADIGGGTNFEVAATSFTPDPGRRTTKIVFTDGGGGTPQTTRVNEIIWVVFGNYVTFKPLGGRIIRVSEKDQKDMESIGFQNSNNEEKSKQFIR